MSIELSVVLPIYNEAASLREAVGRLEPTLAALGRGYEIVCVDDGSTDATAEVLDALARRLPSLRVIRFTRNFGKEAALHAGLCAARGEAAIFLDADLQHPPELIPQMVELWSEHGYDVVDARKRVRADESGTYRFFSALFNRLLGAATATDMRGASDYKLLSRAAMDALVGLPERHRFFRGLVQWIGFRTARVEFDVEPRRGGESAWGRLALLRYGVDSILSFTTAPLVGIAAAGVATTALGSVLGGIALYQWATGVAVSGFTTVILMLLLFSGIILASLGTMSLYLARLFEEVKGRPLYVVRAQTKPSDARGDG